MKKIVYCAFVVCHPLLSIHLTSQLHGIKQVWKDRKKNKQQIATTHHEQPPSDNSLPPIIERRVISAFADNPVYRQHVKLFLCSFTEEKTINLQPLEQRIIEEHDQRTWDNLPWYSKFKHNHPILTECARFAAYSAAGALIHYLYTTHYEAPATRALTATKNVSLTASVSTQTPSLTPTNTPISSVPGSPTADSLNSDGYLNINTNK